MWTRGELKDRAKIVLKRSYWPAFLVSLILGIFGDSSGSGGGGSSGATSTYSNYYSFNNLDPEVLISLIAIFIAIFITVFLFAFALRTFVGSPISVAGRKFFIDNSKGDCNLNNLGYSFRNNKYWNIVKTMLYTNVLIFLWTLLLIIPGIIKGYAYSMVPYILAENPDIDNKKAVEISNSMTYGHKFDIWVLDLSFLGWYLLGVLACGIGVVFVKPYHDATKAELYLSLKESGENKGISINESSSIKDEVIADDIILDDQKY